ncbi:MAG: ABC transporter substrate-binding protein [Desulfobaccales bacterium]
MAPHRLGCLILVILLWVGIWASPAPAQVTIGCYLPMTGAAAAMGQMVWEGVQIARQIRPRVLNQEVKLVLVDTKSDKMEAANAVSRLIEKDRVAAIIGEVISSDTLAGSPIAERAQVPNITPTATNPLVTQNKVFAFRACFADDLQGKVAARYAWEHLKARRVAVLIDQAQDYCVGLSLYFMREFKRLGGEVVSMTHIQTGDQDFSAQIAAIKAKNPDLLYAPNYYAENALLARQMKNLGVQVPILTGDGAQVPELISLGGPAVNGMYFTAHFHRDQASTQLAKDFRQLFEKAYKKELGAFAALGADSYFLLLQAMTQANSLEGSQIAQVLAGLKDFPGVSGTITMDQNHNPVKGVVIIKVDKGKFLYQTTINPEERGGTR